MAHHATLTLWERQLPPKTALPRVNAVPHKRLPRELILPEDIYVNYGYINEEPYEKPDAYVRWMQPNEEELSRQVEYDMDEQGRFSRFTFISSTDIHTVASVDMYWLKAYNEERRKQGTLDAISEELFEIVMDRLEKEWFDLSSRIPKAPVDIRVEDSICEICNDGEAENSNAIVFCDGCNLAVHQGQPVCDDEVRYETEHSCSTRLLWRSLHSRGTMAVQEMHSLSTSTRGMPLLPFEKCK